MGRGMVRMSGYWRRTGSGTGTTPNTMVYGEWEWVSFVPITFYVPPVDPPATWPTPYVARGVPPYTPTEEQPTRIGGTEA